MAMHSELPGLPESDDDMDPMMSRKRDRDERDIVPHGLALSVPDAPPWVQSLQLQLQRHMTAEIDRVSMNQNVLHEEVEALKAARVVDASRIEGLERQMHDLVKSIKDQPSAMPSARASYDPPQPDPWAAGKLGVAIPPPPSLGGPGRLQSNTGNSSSVKGDTDWSHWVLGGWDMDTPKGVVEKDVVSFLQTHPIPNLVRYAVYGKRTRVAHLFFPQQSEANSKSHFFEWLPKINKVHKLNNGVLMWVSPSKSFERRAWNRSTGKAIDRLTKLCNDDGASLETDWNAGIIWHTGKRVATADAKHLMALTTDKLITVAFPDDACPGLSYSFNLSVLETLLNKSCADVEASLRTE